MMKRLCTRLCLCLWLLLGPVQTAFCQSEVQEVSQIRIGVVAYLRPSPNEPIIEPTIALIQKRFPQAQVTTQVLTMDRLALAIKSRSIDIFIASAGFYRREADKGASAIAAVAHVSHPNPNRSEGSAFVVRRDSPLQTIDDLRGLRLMAATPDGFTAMRVAQGELYDRGYDPFTFFSSTQYSGPGEKIADIVRHLKGGTVDVGIFRTCWIEDWMRSHPQDKYEFRVIEPQQQVGYCQSSTPLYPSWVIAATPHLPPEVSRVIARAVLDMPATESGHFWSLITDFSQTDELFRKLKVGPYQYLREWSVRRIWENFSSVLIAAALALLGLIAHSVRTAQLVRKRTAALKNSLARERELKRAALEAADRIDRLQRAGIVGQISSMIAHELRQPLAALSLYTKGLGRMISSGADTQSVQGVLEQIEGQTQRINGIVEHVRAYANSKSASQALIDLREVRQSASHSGNESARHQNISVHYSAPEPIRVTANALEWEIVVLNLIKNAAEAQKGQSRGSIRVCLTRVDGKTARLTVADEGPAVPEQVLSQLSEPLLSSKSEGLGLGLSIVRGIVEAHGARLSFESLLPHGICAIITIPLGDGPRRSNPTNEPEEAQKS